MRLPTLRLANTVSEKWIERCDKTIRAHWDNLMEYDKIHQNLREPEPIIYELFIRNNGQNIPETMASLIYTIIKPWRVKGVWKMVLYPGTVSPVIGVKLYGYKTDVRIVKNILHYLLNGFDRYSENHIAELRRKRINRRRRGVKLPVEVDARKRTQQNILIKVDKLIWTLYFKSTFKKPNPYNEYKIIEMIKDREIIDYKKYKKMKEPTVKSMTSRKGKIQLNRLV